MAKRASYETETGPALKKARSDDEHRFLVGNMIPGIVIGKGGEKVKTIREEANVNVSISNNESGASDDRIMSIRGDPTKTAHAMFLITQLILDHNAGSADSGKAASTDAKLLFHKAVAGAIIGKGGATIKQIMADSGAQIRLTNDPLPGSTDKSCSITGGPQEIQSAVEIILTKLAENPLRDNTQSINYLSAAATAAAAPAYPPPAANDPYAAAAAYYGYAQPPAAAAGGQYAYNPYNPTGAAGPPGHPGMAPMGAAPVPQTGMQIQAELTVPAATAGAIIGKGGAAVSNIKAVTGCHVSVGDPNEQGMRPVTVRGATDALPMALSMVRELAEPTGSVPQQTAMISVPTNTSGSVIGKGGKAINEIKSMSACHVSLAEASEADPNSRAVTIQGGPVAIQVASYLVNRKCELHAQGGGGPPMNPGDSTSEVIIPTALVGNIIGKRGATINGIKAQSGCHISIGEALATDPNQRVATVKGSAQGIQAAVYLINQYMQAGAAAYPAC